jgi:chromosome segregation ATPase
MWTGRQTLASIEEAIAKLRGEESALDAALRSAVADAERLRTERSQSLRELARIKLDEMMAGRLVDNLDAGERRALQILEDYRLRVAAVGAQRDKLQAEVARAEAERHTAAAAVESALDAVDRLRAEAEAKVEATEAWRTAKMERDQAEAIAAEAEKKAAASEAELGAKKKPYDDDPLFAYLWRHGFGTAKYTGGRLVRAVDRVVAHFISYDAIRPNYSALMEIPLRLREHATARREAVAERQAVLAEIARRALVEAGVEAKEKILVEARHNLAVLDDTAEKKRELLRKIDESRNALVAGDANPAYNEALTTIAAADAEDSLVNLYAEARRTPTDADEAIVAKLEAIATKMSQIETEIAKLRKQVVELSQRRSEMQEVRESFRRSGYDHPQITFDNDGNIGNVLGGILEGAVRSGVLWDMLRQGHRSLPTRTSSDFGMPGFPLPFPTPGSGANDTWGGGWRNPTSRGGWAPAPPERRSDSDDFTTGGSF